MGEFRRSFLRAGGESAHFTAPLRVAGLANPVLEPKLRSMCQLRRGLADLDDLDAASEPPAGAMLDNAGMHGGQRRDHGGQRRDAWRTTPGCMVDNAGRWSLDQPFYALDRRCRDQDV
jgi:hypothetical protein